MTPGVTAGATRFEFLPLSLVAHKTNGRRMRVMRRAVDYDTQQAFYELVIVDGGNRGESVIMLAGHCEPYYEMVDA